MGGLRFISTMTWPHWKAHFETNAARAVPPVDVPQLPAHQHAALTLSLARFQLGETGEGRIAHQIDSVSLPGIDDNYRAALKLFVAEEGRHARILGLMVKAFGGRLPAKGLSEGAFTFIRGLVGVRFKLLVLLAAEVVGIAFYGVLGRALPDCDTARALEQLRADEEAHLRFHCEFFATQRGSLVFALLRLIWWPLGIAGSLAVMFEHRRTLDAFGLGYRSTARALLSRIAESSQRMGTGRRAAALAAS